MKSIVFHVFGEPKPQPRARSFVLRGKGGRPIMSKTGQPIIRVHEAGTAENWKSLIAQAAAPHVPMPPLLGPLSIAVRFIFPRPKAHFRANGELKPDAPRWCATKRNDVDNLYKALTDCLTVLGMWEDDGQICHASITKTYVEPSDKPGATVRIYPITQNKETGNNTP